jgi:hypothetical protein
VNFTITALYQLGRREEGDRILFPILRAYEEGEFQGRGPNGKTKDWKRWDGTPKGYEGLLGELLESARGGVKTGDEPVRVAGLR